MEDRVRKTFKFPAGLVREVEEYQRENFIPTFAGAVYELIRKGLEIWRREKRTIGNQTDDKSG